MDSGCQGGADKRQVYIWFTIGLKQIIILDEYSLRILVLG